MADRHHVSNQVARIIASPDRLLSATVFLGVSTFALVVIIAAIHS